VEAAAVLVVALVAVLLAAGTGLKLASWLGGEASRMEAWRAAVRRAGLASLEERSDGMAGWSGRLRVHLSRYRASGNVGGTRITISASGLFGALRAVKPESIETAFLHRTGRHDVETGDPDFDRAVWVQGEEAPVLAVLDASARSDLRALVRGLLPCPGRSSFWAIGRIENDALYVDLPEELPERHQGGLFTEGHAEEVHRALYLGGRPEHLPEAIDAALGLARLLTPPEDVPQRLASNLGHEPLAAVRRRLLDALTTGFPAHPSTVGCVRLALADPDADVRAQAAVAAGPEGRGVLLAVAHGEGAVDETSAGAVAALASSLTVAEAIDVLRNALRLRKLLTARACLRLLGTRGGRDAVDMLSRVLAVEREEVAEWAAAALGSTGDGAAEPALRRALSSPGARRRAAAAQALGDVGTLAALPDLRRAEDGEAGLRRAARHAIALIRSRTEGAEPGQLSLAADTSGRVSLAETDRSGELSLAEQKDVS
jgi:hypothetical protein